MWCFLFLLWSWHARQISMIPPFRSFNTLHSPMVCLKRPKIFLLSTCIPAQSMDTVSVTMRRYSLDLQVSILFAPE